MGYYEQSGISDSDARYIAEEAGRQARYDAERYVDEQLSLLRGELHISFQDLRDGLSEFGERLYELEKAFDQHNTHGTGQV